MDWIRGAMLSGVLKADHAQQQLAAGGYALVAWGPTVDNK
jgi:hypothetical protein